MKESQGISPERQPVEEKDSRIPHKIRGHHLKHIEYSLREKSPKGLARDLTNVIADKKNPNLSEEVKRLYDTTPYRRTDERYAYDVLGSTDTEQKGFTNGVTDIVKQMHQLPDDAPVQIIEGKDALCGACVHGRHCDLDKDDRPYLEAFTQFASDMGLEDTIVVSSDEVKYSDRYFPTATKKIDTTIGTVRRVLEVANMDSRVERIRREREHTMTLQYYERLNKGYNW